MISLQIDHTETTPIVTKLDSTESPWKEMIWSFSESSNNIRCDKFQEFSINDSCIKEQSLLDKCDVESFSTIIASKPIDYSGGQEILLNLSGDGVGQIVISSTVIPSISENYCPIKLYINENVRGIVNSLAVCSQYNSRSKRYIVNIDFGLQKRTIIKS